MTAVESLTTRAPFIREFYGRPAAARGSSSPAFSKRLVPAACYSHSRHLMTAGAELVGTRHRAPSATN